ncbi:hypothetical protein ACIU1J_20770 [Azospirillum doebereinerae]|uniref:hypothetical protein n=1 Tax=Azospirillum doebereinerae TaxID=92933 RepID=UPI001EE4F3C3|nr:hypothetical protein [Azospirillum doebereinerae]MCG5241495.1 hypothetical protein [Azospirillum doebereinerae]
MELLSIVMSGALCALIARKRGRRAWLWFLLGLFPPMLLVVPMLRRINQLIPDQAGASPRTSTSSPYDMKPAPGLPSRSLTDTRPCPRCAETIKRAALVCRFCNANLEAESPGPHGATVGDTVIHPIMGTGIIARIEADGVALVQFGREESRIALRHLKPKETAEAKSEDALS